MKGPIKLYIVPHSHIDVEWYWTAQDTKQMMPQLFYDTTLRVLDTDPQMRFAQDQTVIWDMMLQGASEAQKKLIMEKVRCGEMEPVGGNYVQPEVQEPCGEAFIRQLQFGQKWMQENLGRRAVCAWHTDAFGQTSQLPQIFRQAGFESFAFMRDIAPQDDPETFPTEFYLQGPDGSTILTHWLRISYVLCQSDDPEHRLVVATIGGPQEEEKELRYAFRQLLEEDSLQHKTGLAMLPWGGDVYGLTLCADEIRRELICAARKVGLSLQAEDIIISTPSEFFRALEQKKELLAVKRCDLNPPKYRQDLRGTYISRIGLKQMNRRAEQALLSYESLCACAGQPAEDLRQLWEPVLFGQFHDTIGGSCTDEVYTAAMERDEAVIQTVSRKKAAILGSGDGMLLNVYNPTQFASDELLTVAAESDCIVRREDGTPLYSRYDAGRGLLTVRVEKLAPYETVTLYAEKTQREPECIVAQALENEYYRLHLDPVSGNLDSIWDKETNRELLWGQGNVTCAMAEHDPDMEGEIRLTGQTFTDEKIPASKITARQTDNEICIKVVKEFLGFRLEKTITLQKGKKLVEFHTEILDYPGTDLIVCAGFDFAMQSPRSVYETAFATEEGREGLYCAQKWAGLRENGCTAAIMNRGACAYLTEKNVLRLCLLRAHSNFAEYAKYGMEKGIDRFADGRSHTELAAERGDHVFDYALISGSQTDGEISAKALCYNTPLEAAWSQEPACLTTPVKAVEGPFIITSLTPANGGICLRGYNPCGERSCCAITMTRPVRQTKIVDLLDRPVSAAQTEGNTVLLDLRAYEIVTLHIS